MKLWYASNMTRVDSSFFAEIYKKFEAPITEINCGSKCAPYNKNGVPFCCDTLHAVPAAYQPEWDYLQSTTDLWHLWGSSSLKHTEYLLKQTPDDQVLIECLGHKLCQRAYRSITCRAFPFFPYIDHKGLFIGLSYYWQYEDRCWIISNMHVVTKQYLNTFIEAYDSLFAEFSDDKDNFRQFSITMRRTFGRKKRAIPLLHRNGNFYKISPRHGRIRRVLAASLPRYGPYKIAAKLWFPDEVSDAIDQN